MEVEILLKEAKHSTMTHIEQNAGRRQLNYNLKSPFGECRYRITSHRIILYCIALCGVVCIALYRTVIYNH